VVGHDLAAQGLDHRGQGQQEGLGVGVGRGDRGRGRADVEGHRRRPGGQGGPYRRAHGIEHGIGGAGDGGGERLDLDGEAGAGQRVLGGPDVGPGAALDEGGHGQLDPDAVVGGPGTHLNGTYRVV